MPIESLPPAFADQAIELWHEVGLTRPWNDPAADLDRALGGPASTVLCALDGDLLIGTAMVGDDGHRGWIYYLAVRPGRQGSGVGRALIEASEGWLRGRGVPKVNLMVRSTNRVVLGFYDSLGYADADTVVLARPLD